MGEGVAARMTELFATSGSAPARPFPELTNREFDIVALVADRADNSTIARRLFLSEKTVRNNVSNALAKLHAKSRAEVVARARRAGLGSPE